MNSMIWLQLETLITVYAWYFCIAIRIFFPLNAEKCKFNGAQIQYFKIDFEQDSSNSQVWLFPKLLCFSPLLTLFISFTLLHYL